MTAFMSIQAKLDKAAIQKKIEAAAGQVFKGAMTVLMDQAFHYTPVYSGKTIVNWQFSVGSPAAGVRDEVEVPATDWEGTNKMPLGREPRRAANEAIARATFAAMNFSRPFQKYYLTNNHEDAGRLEYGEIPMPPFRKRQPPIGMLGMAVLKVGEWDNKRSRGAKTGGVGVV